MKTTRKTKKKTRNVVRRKSQDPFEIVASERGDQTRITIIMDRKEYHVLARAMKRKSVMKALCGAAEKTKLNKAMAGSTYCTICHSSGIRHQHTAKNWFNAFWESISYCGPSFAMHRGKCSRPFVNHG